MMATRSSGKYGLASSAVPQTMYNDVNLNFLGNLVTAKTKSAIAEVACRGGMYTDALKILERKIYHP